MSPDVLWFCATCGDKGELAEPHVRCFALLKPKDHTADLCECMEPRSAHAPGVERTGCHGFTMASKSRVALTAALRKARRLHTVHCKCPVCETADAALAKFGGSL